MKKNDQKHINADFIKRELLHKKDRIESIVLEVSLHLF